MASAALLCPPIPPFYPNTDEVYRDVWECDWRKELLAGRLIDLIGVAPERVAHESERLHGNLRACMRDAEPCNDFTVHYSWPWPVVKILGQRKLMVAEGEWVLALTGLGWAVRVHMQGEQPWTAFREFTHKHWEQWP